MLDKASILAAQDLKTEVVAVPEWGGDVTVRMLTAADRDALSFSLIGPDGKTNTQDYKAKLVARCLVGEDGQRLFADDEVQLLGAKSAVALERVFVVADRLNQISNAAIEEAEKN